MLPQYGIFPYCEGVIQGAATFSGQISTHIVVVLGSYSYFFCHLLLNKTLILLLVVQVGFRKAKTDVNVRYHIVSTITYVTNMNK